MFTNLEVNKCWNLMLAQVFLWTEIPDCSFKGFCVGLPWKRRGKNNNSQTYEETLGRVKLRDCLQFTPKTRWTPGRSTMSGTRSEWRDAVLLREALPGSIWAINGKKFPPCCCVNRRWPTGGSGVGTGPGAHMTTLLTDLLTQRREKEEVDAKTEQRKQVRIREPLDHRDMMIDYWFTSSSGCTTNVW